MQYPLRERANRQNNFSIDFRGAFSVDDLADVGTDDGTPVTDYGPSKKFTGTLNKLTIKTSG
jgi:hypothetical protein